MEKPFCQYTALTPQRVLFACVVGMTIYNPMLRFTARASRSKFDLFTNEQTNRTLLNGLHRFRAAAATTLCTMCIEESVHVAREATHEIRSAWGGYKDKTF